MNSGVLSYKEAGVDIPKLDHFKKNIGKSIHRTYGPEVLSKIGGFGGLFHLDRKKYKDPVLVSSVDGVGTKLKVAAMMNRHDTVGIDIVSHCANDIVVQGAKPLFFLDYIGSGRLNPKVGNAVIQGLVKGCQIAGCALIGGETAEMPGMYSGEDYDLVGTIVGVVERKKIIDGSKVKAGDVILGLASNGLHTNGYSLARKIFFERMNWDVRQEIPELGCSIGDALLKPHTCYSNAILKVYETLNIHAISHLTGGGFPGNIPRVLPAGLKAKIHKGSWSILPIFQLMQRLGNLPDEEMFRAFNMGIGIVIIIAKKDIETAQRLFKKTGFDSRVIGEIVKGKSGVEFVEKKGIETR
ncbi:MAG: phosphoribosylformylglycinamidine cyclo-ligase [Chlamydiae bacterium]|nr:phosphoribosylformylglycinamidine cyclo-ligase [Chlamydiota bacterium]MBI3276340.1 phosphoribosylformylglycinamidine cyclo-ligase [Chlamydiota bacterium]